MTEHACARPSASHDGQRWRCPDCGMLWELLPAETKKARRQQAFRWGGLGLTVVAVAAVACAGWWGTILAPIAFPAALGALLVTAIGVAVWQNRRS